MLADGTRGHSRTSSNRVQLSLLWKGLLVGLLAGLVVTLYRFALMWAERLVRAFTSVAAHDPVLIVGWLCALAGMALAVGLLLRWEPDSSGSGIPQVYAEVRGSLNMRWSRVLAAKFSAGSLCALAGLSLGREGPSVLIGSMIGKGVSRKLGRRRGEERLLVTCGAGAGMAAAFHAPLTGVMFVLEGLRHTFNAALVIPVMSAALAADYMASQFLGPDPSISLGHMVEFPHEAYAMLIPFGIAMGVVGALHNLGMFAFQDVFARVRARAPHVCLMLPFALAGLVAFSVPVLMDGGDAILALLASPTSLTPVVLIALLLGKFFFTGVCFGSGAPGGTLFPLVVMGALSGMIFGGALVGIFGMNTELITTYALLGIAGMFAGVVRAPVTAVVLAFELTGSLTSLLPLIIVSVLAYVSANLLKVEPYYKHLLERLLVQGTNEVHGRG